MTRPLVDLMHAQSKTLCFEEDIPSKDVLAEILKERDAMNKRKLDVIIESSNSLQARLLEQSREKGASSWLSVLPLIKQGFVLNKSEFRDAMCLRYGKPLKNLPSKCPCGQQFTPNHAMNCKRGGFVIIRHNEIRDFEANLLQDVCKDVEIEPALQPVSNEVISSLDGDAARPDIRARGFWRRGQNAFFDVKVSNINSQTYRNTDIKKVYDNMEKEKKRAYSDRIINIEHGTFTPLIFSIAGGMGREASIYHRALANKISLKTGDKYCNVVNFIRCKLSFIIQKLALLCLRGSRSLKSNISEVPSDYDFTCLESRLKF